MLSESLRKCFEIAIATNLHSDNKILRYKYFGLRDLHVVHMWEGATVLKGSDWHNCDNTGHAYLDS